MNYPNYASTADIEVINNNIKKLVQNAEEQDTQIKSKEPAIGEKNDGFNLKKTDLVENDTNKVFSAKGAFDLKTWLVTNYTTLMNNIRENLTNMINTKTPHGGYNKSSQDLKNDIDTKASKAGDTFTGYVGFNKGFRSTSNILIEIGLADKEFPNGINDNNSNFLTDYIAKYTCHNNALTIFGQNAFNARRMAIQSSHSSTSYAEVPGILELNPYGGDVRINGAKAYCENYKPKKSDVGLDLVNNWDASSAVNDSSNSKYATAGAVKKAYDKGVEALNKGNEVDENKYSKTGGILNGIPVITTPQYPGVTLVATGNEAKFRKVVLEMSPTGRIYLITRDDNGNNTGSVYIEGTESGKLYHTGSPPTKAAVGLDLVSNWDASSAVNDSSNSKYATAGAVKKAYDKGMEALNNSNTKMTKGYVESIGTSNNTDPVFLKDMGVYYVGANGYQGLPAWSSIFNMSPHAGGYANLQLSWYHGGNSIKTGQVKIRTISDQGDKSRFESLMVRNGIFDGAGTLNAMNNSSQAWNQDGERVFSMMGGNNKMNFWVNNGFNARQGYIQVGHNDPSLSSVLGTLNLNPFGGEVKVGGSQVLTKARLNRISPIVWSGSSYTAEFTLPDGISWADILYIGCVGNNDSATLDGLFINSMSNGESVLCGYVQGQSTDMATNFIKVSDKIGRFTQSGSGNTGGADQTWPITKVFIRRID